MLYDADDILYGEEPPSYDVQDSVPTPFYSLEPRASEVMLLPHPQSSMPTSSTESKWSYKTKHMIIDLGPQIWGQQAPTLGLGAKVEGAVSFIGSHTGVERVSVTLEGQLSTCLPQRTGAFVTVFLCQEVPLYIASQDGAAEWDEDHHFSIPIPMKVHTPGCSEYSPTPPSFSCYHYTGACEISYTLKVLMVRKGKTPWKNEIKTIPITYLPKSSPTQPPISQIPRPTSIGVDASSPLYLHMFDRVETTPLTPTWSLTSKLKSPPSLDCFSDAIHFSIPTPMCFSSGASIPFTCSLSFPHEPALARVLVPHIKVCLMKRVIISSYHKSCTKKKCLDALDGVTVLPCKSDPNSHTIPMLYREWKVSSGQLQFLNEYKEGRILVRGSIPAGGIGREASWKLGDLAEVTYLLRVTLAPPKYLEGRLPSFQHEVGVDMTTDPWGSVNRELSALGGVPTPALGLMKSSDGSDTYVIPWGWTGF